MKCAVWTWVWVEFFQKVDCSKKQEQQFLSHWLGGVRQRAWAGGKGTANALSTPCKHALD